jgi:hypothetical protein
LILSLPIGERLKKILYALLQYAVVKNKKYFQGDSGGPFNIQVLISPTFYEQLFLFKRVWRNFYVLAVWVSNFIVKAACKMLVKLTTGSSWQVHVHWCSQFHCS